MPYFSRSVRRPGFEAKIAFVLDPAAFDIDAQKQLPVPLIMPADVIVDVGHVDRIGIDQRSPVVLFDFLFECWKSPVGDQVFQPRDLAVLAIAEVSLHFHDGFRDVDHLVRCDECEPLGDGGERFVGAGRDSHAAAATTL